MKIWIFEAIIAAELYCGILKRHRVPFINLKLPNRRFMQDNDPKHTSRAAKTFFEEPKAAKRM